MQLILGREG